MRALFVVGLLMGVAVIVLVLSLAVLKCRDRGGVLALTVWPLVACVEVVK